MAISVVITSVAGIPVTAGQTSVDISQYPNGPWVVLGTVGAGAMSMSYALGLGGSKYLLPAGGAFNFTLFRPADINANGSYLLSVDAFGGADSGSDTITIVQNGIGYGNPLPAPPGV